jgi:hypothetical protein
MKQKTKINVTWVYVYIYKQVVEKYMGLQDRKWEGAGEYFILNTLKFSALYYFYYFIIIYWSSQVYTAMLTEAEFDIIKLVSSAKSVSNVLSFTSWGKSFM